MADAKKRNRLGNALHSLLTFYLVLGCVAVVAGAPFVFGYELVRLFILEPNEQPAKVMVSTSAGFSSDFMVQKNDGSEIQATVSSYAAAITLGDNSIFPRLWSHLLLFANVVINLWIVVLLRRILVPLLRNIPFVPENSRRIRMIGLLLCTWWGVLLPILDNVSYRIWLSYYSIDNSQLDLHLKSPDWIDLKMLGVGMVVLVLSEAFHLGTNLQEENTLTV